MPQTGVSVIMPTYNRCGQLQAVLPSYLASPLTHELIIIDDASTDSTQRWGANLESTDPRIRYVRNSENLGLPASRNRGTALASCDWVLHTEDDLALGEHCLETLIDHANRQSADIIAGRRIWVRIGESEADALRRSERGAKWLFNERFLEHNSQAITRTDVETPLLNATMLVRRHVAQRLRHFEAFGGQSSWREDSDYQLSALEAGYRLVFCPHAVTYHYSRSSQSFGANRFWGTLVYAYRVYWNNLIFLNRHRDYLRRNHPKALFLGMPYLSAVVYGLYRGGWLLTVEILRSWRTLKFGAPVWR